MCFSGEDWSLVSISARDLEWARGSTWSAWPEASVLVTRANIHWFLNLVLSSWSFIG